jgi:hypothetical protein
MAPFFTIFNDPKRKLTTLHVAETLKKYYPIFMDGVNIDPLLMKNKYKNSNSKFFALDEDIWLMIDLETVDLIPPSFVLTFDTGYKVSKNDWKLVRRWVQAIFTGDIDDELNRQMLLLVPKPKEPEEIVTMTKQIEPKCIPDKKDYLFRYDHDKESDICLIEVEKPYTDKPYTAVIRNFTEKGFLPFFTSLYVCSSWGVCSKDHQFLVHLWDHLQMNQKFGPIDLENRLKQDIENCIPKEGFVPNAEPEVYRKTIEEVKEFWSNKRKLQSE